MAGFQVFLRRPKQTVQQALGSESSQASRRTFSSMSCFVNWTSRFHLLCALLIGFFALSYCFQANRVNRDLRSVRMDHCADGVCGIPRSGDAPKVTSAKGSVNGNRVILDVYSDPA